MIPVEEARDRVLECASPLPPRRIALADALGLVLAEEVVADQEVPPFPNTAMDGYAVRAVDTRDAPVPLAVVGSLAAGSAPDRALGPGEAIRIMTGAPIPPGADAVVMVERTRPGPDGTTVVIDSAASPGDHVRRAGDDLRSGQTVFEVGQVLTPAHLGVLASLGRTAVEVVPRPRVGVLSTGDELVEGGAPLRPGQIRDANRPTLLALVRQEGWPALDLGQAGDDPSAIRARLQHGLAECDAVITSGGVSVGDHDHVADVLGDLGRMQWWQVAVKPAKPLAFGVAGGRPLFGLPGNPVSAMVSFELFARPALRRMAGHTGDRLQRPTVVAVAEEALTRRRDGKLHLVRTVARLADDGRVRVRPLSGQGSHQLRAMALANSLAMVPDGDGVGAGGTVKTMLLGRLG